MNDAVNRYSAVRRRLPQRPVILRSLLAAAIALALLFALSGSRFVASLSDSSDTIPQLAATKVPLTASPATPSIAPTDTKVEGSTNVTATGFDIEYLPPILDSMVSYYKGNLWPKSLSMMLPPVQYSDDAMSCSALRARHQEEVKEASSRVDFSRPPKYKMPWYFHDPYALCGRYQLTHLLNGDPLFVHRLKVSSASKRESKSQADQMAVARVAVGEWSDGDITIEHCGSCAEKGARMPCSEDVLLMARLVGKDTVTSADVVAGSDGQLRLRFLLREPGEYVLEVKVTHVNGSHHNASIPKSLGVIGIRASDQNKKSFKYNLACDLQRHVHGSPLKVIAEGLSSKVLNDAPLCSNRTLVQEIGAGHWARVPYNVSCDDWKGGRVCAGDPKWMTDACGFNKELIWRPDSCKFRVYSPPAGPPTSCLKRGKSGFLLLVGDSVTREYVQNCRLFDFRSAKLHCLFNNIALEGQHYSRDYAVAVAKAIIDSLRTNRPGVFATNLGVHHMIGKSSTEQWIEFIDIFVELWIAAKFEILPVGTDQWLLEKAVWLGPPTIQYARHGMGYQRGALWDEIAWAKLKPLGFLRLYAIPATLARTEGTWDGLHYASQKGKVQSPWRNREAPVLLWNGGVSNMLFNMLLNLICE